MAELPVLQDWKTLVENKLKKAAYTEKDIREIAYLCQDFLGEIQPVGRWLGEQEGFVRQMQQLFNNMYFTMFGSQPPPRPEEVPIKEVHLDTPESRKQAIREVALSITQPGSDVSDEAVLEELNRRGMKIDAHNPTAAISTVLRGFSSHFEKVPGARGVFKRRK